MPLPVAAFVVTHPTLSFFVIFTTVSAGIIGLCAYDSVRTARHARPSERDEHEVDS